MPDAPHSSAGTAHPSATEDAGGQTDAEGHRRPLRRVEPAPRLQSRLLDVTVAGLALVTFAPVGALLALLIRLDSPGPALFVQDRVGLGGRRFRCYKFRTMRTDVAQPDWRVEDFSTFVFNPGGHDPRRTRLGTALRRSTVDELPQLLNVLRGDMSLLGPRPEIPEIVQQYDRPAYHLRHRVRPGMAGLAVARGRADLTYEQGLAYDLEYARTRSHLGDLKILARSVRAVLKHEGAR